MKSNLKRTIKRFFIDEWNYVSLDVTCEGVFFVFLNGREEIGNTLDREEAEQIFQEMKR